MHGNLCDLALGIDGTRRFLGADKGGARPKEMR